MPLVHRGGTEADHDVLPSNLAMIIAGREKKKPLGEAAQLVELLVGDGELIERCEIAGLGLCQLLHPSGGGSRCCPRSAARTRYGLSEDPGRAQGAGRIRQRQPHRPLVSVGHGARVLGDAICRLLIATGHNVTRGIMTTTPSTDAGAGRVQPGPVTLSCWAAQDPEDGYRSGRVYPAHRQGDGRGVRRRNTAPVTIFKERAERAIFADINGTLERLGIHFDNYYNEHTLYDQRPDRRGGGGPARQGLVYDLDDAVWLKPPSLATTRIG